MLPRVMEYNLSGNYRKYAEIASAMGETVTGLAPWEAAAKAVEAVKRLMGIINLPAELSAYGIPRSDLPKLVEGGWKQQRLLVGSPRPVSRDDLRRILEESMVLW